MIPTFTWMSVWAAPALSALFGRDWWGVCGRQLDDRGGRLRGIGGHYRVREEGDDPGGGFDRRGGLRGLLAIERNLQFRGHQRGRERVIVVARERHGPRRGGGEGLLGFTQGPCHSRKRGFPGHDGQVEPTAVLPELAKSRLKGVRPGRAIDAADHHDLHAVQPDRFARSARLRLTKSG